MPKILIRTSGIRAVSIANDTVRIAWKGFSENSLLEFDTPEEASTLFEEILQKMNSDVIVVTSPIHCR